MHAINISYFKLDLSGKTIEYNEDFINLFNLNCIKEQLSIECIFDVETMNQYQFMNEMEIGEHRSFIQFRNFQIKNNHQAMLILYIIVTKQNNYYLIRMVNWLNWLHNIVNSMEYGYGLIKDFNDTMSKNIFTKISDASCYKALYPLATYIPRKLSNGISQLSLFEIMRIFIKQRNELKYSRDYARNIYSRIRTNLKQEYGLYSMDIIDLLKNDNIVNIKFGDQICIPRTILAKNITVLVEHDALLILLINKLCPINS